MTADEETRDARRKALEKLRKAALEAEYHVASSPPAHNHRPGVVRPEGVCRGCDWDRGHEQTP